MALQDQVSDNVRVLAAVQGSSPSGVAQRLGKSRQWIQNKLVGRAAWSMAEVEALSDVLGVPALELMTTDWWPEQLQRARRDSNPKPSDLWRVAA